MHKRVILAILSGVLFAATAPSAAAAQSRPATADVVLPAIQTAKFTTSDGVRLQVLEAAPATPAANAPVLAFVPGWAMPAAIWRDQLALLGERYRVAALDPRGQGDSDVPAQGYTVERRARDIAEFVARYPRVVLIGWSLGALECLHYVHLYGERKVAALVLVDSSVGEHPPPPAGRFTESLRGDRAAAVERFVHAMFRGQRPPEELQALVEGALRLPAKASIALLSYPQPRTHWRDIAWAFRKPLLYVVTPQFAEQAKNLRRNRPGTRIEVFEHAGHALFADEPQRFNALLEEFVRGL